ncbi:uncharacterized protein LOC119720788 [Patiria miniata]|uniref:Uncharacterized protein n=1 Tax=Patiria miniata TaxID=46514 RepID=A0A913Z4B4_PATMI|nr:uncharacterized protein LOC119720788 [Patiria miniata]
MAASLSSQIAYAFFGIVIVLCIATVRCAPVSNTSSSTTNLVPCESTDAATTSHIILPHATAFLDACKNVFDDFVVSRSGPLPNDYLELFAEYIPNIAVFSDNMSENERLATHYFILEGFRRPMEAVIIDDGQYPETQRFDAELQNLSQLLQTVTQGVQELVCSNGASGQSPIGAMEDLLLPSRDNYVDRILWDYTVLYYMNQYSSNLHSDILISIP